MNKELKKEFTELLQVKNLENAERLEEIYNQYSNRKFSFCLCKESNITRLYIKCNELINELNGK